MSKPTKKLREEITRVLVGYDKRYTVASLTILMDKIMGEFDQALQAQEEEVISLRADIHYAISYIQGCRYPIKYLEKKYPRKKT